MNRYAKFLVISILLTTLLTGISASEVFAHGIVGKQTQDNKHIIPLKSVIECIYKIINGKYYMRLYNTKTQEWIGEWRLVPGQ